MFSAEGADGAILRGKKTREHRRIQPKEFGPAEKFSEVRLGCCNTELLTEVCKTGLDQIYIAGN